MGKIDGIVGKYLNEMKYKTPMDAYKEGDEFSYMNMVIKDMKKKGKLKVGSWKGEEETMMGTWSWTNDEENFVYITPYFEGEEMMSIDWTNTEGDYKTLDKKKFTATGDAKKDFDNYMKIVKMALSKL